MNEKSLSIGASARSILAHLTGGQTQTGDYPRDSGDFGRCEAILDAKPELRARLPEMADVNAYWAALVPHWEAIRAASPEAQTAAIRHIIAPVQKADPDHIPFGPDASIQLGPITLKGDATEDDEDLFQRAVMLVWKESNVAGLKKIPQQEKPTMAGKGHNSAAYNVTADELRQFIERAEQLAAEKKDIAEQEKELFAEAKGRGYDTKVMRKIIALRKRKPDEIAEEEAILTLYCEALGMA